MLAALRRPDAALSDYGTMADHHLLITGDAGAKPIALAHGAGAPMDSPFMETVAAGLAQRGCRVYRFEFPYMAARRAGTRRPFPDAQKVLLATWREVIAQVGDAGRLIIGGKSMGGRMASLVADEAGVRGLVCLGYPFHPPKKPHKPRTQHLVSISTPTLIAQGERDPFGGKDEVATYALSAQIRFQWLPDGDHSFKPRMRSGFRLSDNMDICLEALAAFAEALCAS